jgi:putative membrane protein
MAVFVRYLHFLSILVLVGTLIAENAMMKGILKRKELGSLAVVDLFFGLSAASTLIAGLLLWFKYGKGAEFYLKNPFFQAKLALFLIVGLLSIYPTLFYLKHRRGGPEERVEVPGKVIGILRLELAIALLIPLFAVIMARGIGL